MNNKTVIKYEEKHHVIEVDGIECVIPIRTVPIEEKIKEHDEKIANMTEYEGNINMLEILFGEKITKQIFPDKSTTNLDKLAKVTKTALALYAAEMYSIQSEELNKNIESVKPVFDGVAEMVEVVKQASKTTNKAKE